MIISFNLDNLIVHIKSSKGLKGAFKTGNTQTGSWSQIKMSQLSPVIKQSIK